MTGGGNNAPPPTQLPFASLAVPGAHGGSGNPTGRHAPLASRNSPWPHDGCGLMHDMPSLLMYRLLQQLPSGIRVYPDAQAGVSGVNAGQCERSAAFTGSGQHSPPLVTFAAAQHLPPPVGMSPGPQQRGPIGIRMGGLHCVLFGPLGTCPLGQHIPVEVIWLAKQQEFPAGT